VQGAGIDLDAEVLDVHLQLDDGIGRDQAGLHAPVGRGFHVIGDLEAIALVAWKDRPTQLEEPVLHAGPGGQPAEHRL
jgi:hypothetical protein